MDTIPFGVYGSYHFGDWYVNGAAGYSLSLYRTTRNLQFGAIDRKAKGEFDGHEANTFAEIGYELKRGRWILTPTASVQYAKLWIDSFSETGADSLNLRIASQQADTLQSGLGGRVSYDWKIGKRHLVPRIQASFQHEFLNDSRGIEAKLAQGSSAFSVQTDSPARDFGLLGAGFSVLLSDSISTYLDYQTQVWQKNFSTHSVNGGVRVGF